MSKPNSSIDQLIPLIFATGKIMGGDIKKSPQATGLPSCSFLQMKTLHFVEISKDTTMKDIADYFGITPPSATSLVNGLVSSGHLTRASNPHDRRRVHLALTSKGKKALKIGFDAITGRIHEVFSCLTEKDRQDLLRILKKLSSYA